jgi:hypothetical protein
LYGVTAAADRFFDIIVGRGSRRAAQASAPEGRSQLNA